MTKPLFPHGHDEKKNSAPVMFRAGASFLHIYASREKVVALICIVFFVCGKKNSESTNNRRKREIKWIAFFLFIIAHTRNIFEEREDLMKRYI